MPTKYVPYSNKNIETVISQMKEYKETGLKVLFLLCMSFLVSCKENTVTSALNIIPLASSIGKYSILNLSDYVTEIRYIPLETNDSVLVSDQLFHIIYENEKIVFYDWKSGCMIFDTNGSFCTMLGNRGQGPNEYLFLHQMFAKDDFVYLKTTPNFLMKYDFNGNLIGKLKKPEGVRDYYGVGDIHLLKGNLFLADITTLTNLYCPKALLFEANDSASTVIHEFPNSVQLEKDLPLVSNYEMAIQYCFKDEIRTYKYINHDTIFTIGPNLEMKEAFIFDLGNHKPSLAFLELKDRKAKGGIVPSQIKESSNHLFLTFGFGTYAPEPFEYLRNIGDLQKITVNHDVCAVFDKNTGKLTLMNQPIKGKTGFKNDIDGGPVIWPQYISTKDELVTFISAEDMLAHVEQLENPSPQLLKVVENIKFDDNPIFIIAKLKD